MGEGGMPIPLLTSAAVASSPPKALTGYTFSHSQVWRVLFTTNDAGNCDTVPDGGGGCTIKVE